MSDSVTSNLAFVKVWLAQLISRIGDSVHEIALIWVVYEYQQDPLLLSFVVAASTGSTALAVLPGGAIADRFNRKHVMVVAEAVRGGAVLAIPLAGDGFLIPVVVTVAAVAGLMEGLFNPARSALIPVIVEEENLDTANAITQMTSSASRILLAVGGAVVALIGAFGAFYVDAVTFLLSALILLTLPTRVGVPEADEERTEEHSFVRGLGDDVRRSLSYIRDHQVLPSLILLSVLLGTALGPLGVVLPFFITEVTGGGSSALGVFYASIFAGIFVGAIVVQSALDRLDLHRGRLIILFTAVAGVVYGGTAAVASRLPVPVVLLGLFLFGASVSTIQIPVNTIAQVTVPDSKRGRVFSVLEAIGRLLPPVAAAVAGPVLTVLDASTFIVVEGVLVGATGLVLALTPLRTVSVDAADAAATADD